MDERYATAHVDRAMKSATDEPEIPEPPPGELELPSDDGEPMETNRHRQQMTLLIQSLKRAWRGRHDFFVGGNMFVYFSETQTKSNDFRGPDVFVVLDTTDRDRMSWVVWGEDGKLPDVVIELLSDRTRAVDRGDKMRIYSKIWRTSEYYLFDPLSLAFEGYRLDAAARDYVRIEPDARGDLRCDTLGLSLGIRTSTFEGLEVSWLRWLGHDGNPVETSEEAELAAALRADAERDRADAERDRADAAERRLAELEQRLAVVDGKKER